MANVCICNDESISTPTECVNVDCKVVFQKKLTHHERMVKCTSLVCGRRFSLTL